MFDKDACMYLCANTLINVRSLFNNISSLPINSKCYINATSAQMPYEHVFLLHQRTLFNYSVSPTIKIEKLFSTEKGGICEKIKNEARLKPLIKKSL